MTSITVYYSHELRVCNVVIDFFKTFPTFSSYKFFCKNICFHIVICNNFSNFCAAIMIYFDFIHYFKVFFFFHVK